MLEKLKQKWLEWLFAIVIVVLGGMVAQYYHGLNRFNSKMEQELEQKADKTYVDTQDNIQAVRLQQHVEDQDRLIQQMNQNYNSIDRKLDILIRDRK